MFIKAITLIEAFSDFITSREAMLVSSGTIRFYKFTAKRFIEWVDVNSPDEITARHVRTYLAELRREQLSDWYINGHARAIKTMLRFFNEEEYTSTLIRFEMPSVGKRRLPVLSLEELKIVIEGCITTRDKAIVLLLADTGLRRAELCSLNWEDINIKSGIVRVTKGKGNKYRTVVMGLTTRNAIKEYVKTVCNNDKEPVFQTSTRKRLSPMGLRSMLMRLGKRTNIHITPHALRRTFATLCLKAGMNLIHLQSLMGHSTLEMTSQYIQLLDDDLLSAHMKHGPLDSFLKKNL
jgi:site-specific recombinase XerD